MAQHLQVDIIATIYWLFPQNDIVRYHWVPGCLFIFRSLFYCLNKNFSRDHLTQSAEPPELENGGNIVETSSDEERSSNIYLPETQVGWIATV